MTALSSYSTGLATVSAGGTTVTGIGTIWSGTNVKPGDIFQIGNFQSVISDLTDTTHLVIPPWGGGAQTSVAYTIWQVSPQRFAGATAMATVNELVAALGAREIPVVVGDDQTEPDPSLGEEDQTAIQPTTGKVWVKSSGGWIFLGIYKGFNPRGEYDNGETYSVGDWVTLDGTSYAWANEAPGSGHSPPNTTYWQLLGSKGDVGGIGPTGAGYGGTSTTSLAIGTGSKAFTTQAGLAYTSGARVRASSAANTANWMEGVATYSGTTLAITVDKTGGSGTHADWNFNVAGEPGAVSGPGSSTSGRLASFSGTSGAVIQDSGIPSTSVIVRVNVVKITASGTYTPSAGLVYAKIELWGGGAGGGGSAAPAASTLAFGGGGGSGEYTCSVVSAATIGASRSITIGTAGSAGTSGNNTGGAGGTTTVSGICSAVGGSGGAGNSGADTSGGAGAGGTGGTVSNGFSLAGLSGQPRGSHGAVFPEAAGANAPFGVGQGGFPSSTPLSPNAATGFAAGGGGAVGWNGSASAGAAGAPGFAIITEYLNQ